MQSSCTIETFSFRFNATPSGQPHLFLLPNLTYTKHQKYVFFLKKFNNGPNAESGKLPRDLILLAALKNKNN